MGLIITPRRHDGDAEADAATGKPAFPPFQKESVASQLVSFAIAFVRSM